MKTTETIRAQNATFIAAPKDVYFRSCNSKTGFIFGMNFFYLSRDNVVGIAAGYWLDHRGIGVRVPVGSGIFSSQSRPDRL
jgi:hypothetical protein